LEKLIGDAKEEEKKEQAMKAFASARVGEKPPPYDEGEDKPKKKKKKKRKKNKGEQKGNEPAFTPLKYKLGESL